MKRLVVFAVLGPPLGLVTGMWGILPVLNWSLGEPSVFDYHQAALLPVAYLVGLVPALLVGVFDGLLARRNIAWRPLWCALFGFAASFLPLLTSFAMGFLHGPFVLLFGLLGAVPAAICSWVAGVLQDRDKRKSGAGWPHHLGPPTHLLPFTLFLGALMAA